MEIFVTGGTGTIGAAVVKRLIADGDRVIALARNETSVETLQAAGANAYPGDLREPRGWAERASACDAVVHAGATFSSDMAQVDRAVLHELRKVAALRKKKLRLIYTGGIWLYPETGPDHPVTETRSFDPLPGFGWAAEHIRSLQNASEFNVSIIHPALVCGTDSGPLHDIATAARSGAPYRTRATADTLWPLVSADDLAGLYSLVLRSRTYRLSVLGAGLDGCRLGDIIDAIAERTGQPIAIETETRPDDRDPKTDWAAGYARSQVVTSRFARRVLNWVPETDTLGRICAKAVRGPADPTGQ